MSGIGVRGWHTLKIMVLRVFPTTAEKGRSSLKDPRTASDAVCLHQRSCEVSHTSMLTVYYFRHLCVQLFSTTCSHVFGTVATQVHTTTQQLCVSARSLARLQDPPPIIKCYSISLHVDKRGRSFRSILLQELSISSIWRTPFGSFHLRRDDQCRSVSGLPPDPDRLAIPRFTALLLVTLDADINPACKGFGVMTRPT